MNTLIATSRMFQMSRIRALYQNAAAPTGPAVGEIKLERDERTRRLPQGNATAIRSGLTALATAALLSSITPAEAQEAKGPSFQPTALGGDTVLVAAGPTNPPLPTLTATGGNAPRVSADVRAAITGVGVMNEITSEVGKSGPDALLPYMYIAIMSMESGLPPPSTNEAAYITGVHAYLSGTEGQGYIKSSLASSGKIHGPAQIILDVVNGVRQKPTPIGMKTVRSSYTAVAIDATFKLNTSLAPSMRAAIAKSGGVSDEELERLVAIKARTTENDRRIAQNEREILKTDIILGAIRGPYDARFKKVVGENLGLFQGDIAVISILQDIVSGKIQKLRPDQIVLFQKYAA